MRLVVRDGVGGIDAAIKGCGILRPFELAIREAVSAGQLQLLLRDWSSDKVGVFAVSPKRRVVPAKVQAFVDFVHRILSSR
jgi:DNA-binding transcriptional LysR family regulator